MRQVLRHRTKFIGTIAFALGVGGLGTAAGSIAAPPAECGVPPGSEPCPAWTAREDVGSRGDVVRDAVVAPDGSSVFVAGDVWISPSQDVAVVSHDAATGVARWTATYDGGAEDFVTAMAISPDGDTVFTTGPSVSGTRDYLTVALDAATGEEIWRSRVDGGGPEDWAHAITTSIDGTRVYVTGYFDEGPEEGNRNFVTLALDADTGERLWAATYDGPAGGGEVARAIETATYLDGEGNLRERVFVTGRSNGADADADENDFATVAYDGETGSELWATRYDGPAGGRDYPMGVAVSPDQETVFVIGESAAPEHGFDYATVAYDAATGEERWTHRFDRSDEETYLVTVSRSPSGDVAVDPSGNRVYVTGYGFIDGNYWNRQAVTFALDAGDGTQLWSAVRTGPLGEDGRHVVVSPDGTTVYMGGQAARTIGGVITSSSQFTGSKSSDVSGFLAVAYDAATGTEEWVAHYGMAASDAQYGATALAPDGSRLFLAGGEFGDLRSVAYAT